MTCACPRGWCYQRTDCRKIDPLAKTPREWRMGCVADRLKWLREREVVLRNWLEEDEGNAAVHEALIFIKAAILRISRQP
jgi:hypothetical protein